MMSGFAPAPSMARPPHEARFGTNVSADQLPMSVNAMAQDPDETMAVHRAARTLERQLREAQSARDLEGYERLYAAADRLNALAIKVGAFGYLQPQLGLPTPMAFRAQLATQDLSAHRFIDVRATGPVWPAQDATYFPAGQAAVDEFAIVRIAGGITPSDWNAMSFADKITYLLNNAADERVLDEAVRIGVDAGYRDISETANAAREAISGIPASAGAYAIESAARTRAAGQVATTPATSSATPPGVPIWAVLVAAGVVGGGIWYYNSQRGSR